MCEKSVLSDKAYSDAVVAGIGEESYIMIVVARRINWLGTLLLTANLNTTTNWHKIFFLTIFRPEIRKYRTIYDYWVTRKMSENGFVLKYKILTSILVWKSSILIRLYNVSSAWTEAVRIDESGFGPFSWHAFSGEIVARTKKRSFIVNYYWICYT